MSTTSTRAPSARRVFGVAVVALLVVAVAAALSIFVGTRQFDPATVLAALTGRAGEEAHAIVMGQRVPRTLLGIVGGAALAVGGALTQAHTRNPLADPGLLGVTAGSALAVVLAISLLGVSTPAGYLWFAFAGALVGTVLVGIFGSVATRRRDAGPASLVLAGAAVSALLGAVTGVILLLDTATLDVYRFWTVGSLAGGRGTEALGVVWPFLVLGLMLALAQAPALNALALGDDIATSLGRNVAGTRVLGLAAIVLLVGGAVACIGSLGFVGLVAPHLVRRLCRDDQRALLPLSAAAGALLVLLADIIGRVVVAPNEIPVGITLGVLGGPAFLVLVVRSARRRRPGARTRTAAAPRETLS
jgi:iron complex transport system permease protein